jgi:hypothetical protein
MIMMFIPKFLSSFPHPKTQSMAYAHKPKLKNMISKVI